MRFYSTFQKKQQTNCVKTPAFCSSELAGWLGACSAVGGESSAGGCGLVGTSWRFFESSTKIEILLETLMDHDKIWLYVLWIWPSKLGIYGNFASKTLGASSLVKVYSLYSYIKVYRRIGHFTSWFTQLIPLYVPLVLRATLKKMGAWLTTTADGFSQQTLAIFGRKSEISWTCHHP